MNREIQNERKKTQKQIETGVQIGASNANNDDDNSVSGVGNCGGCNGAKGKRHQQSNSNGIQNEMPMDDNDDDGKQNRSKDFNCK